MAKSRPGKYKKRIHSSNTKAAQSQRRRRRKERAMSSAAVPRPPEQNLKHLALWEKDEKMAGLLPSYGNIKTSLCCPAVPDAPGEGIDKDNMNGCNSVADSGAHECNGIRTQEPESAPISKKQKKRSSELISGRRIVDICFFIQQLQDISCHGDASCSLKDMVLVSEIQRGFNSALKFKCQACSLTKHIWTNAHTDSEHLQSVNAAAVSGIIAIGCGLAELQKFTATLSIPCIRRNGYKTHRGMNKVEDQAEKDADAEEQVDLEKFKAAGEDSSMDVEVVYRSDMVSSDEDLQTFPRSDSGKRSEIVLHSQLGLVKGPESTSASVMVGPKFPRGPGLIHSAHEMTLPDQNSVFQLELPSDKMSQGSNIKGRGPLRRGPYPIHTKHEMILPDQNSVMQHELPSDKMTRLRQESNRRPHDIILPDKNSLTQSVLLPERFGERKLGSTQGLCLIPPEVVLPVPNSMKTPVAESDMVVELSLRPSRKLVQDYKSHKAVLSDQNQEVMLKLPTDMVNYLDPGPTQTIPVIVPDLSIPRSSNRMELDSLKIEQDVLNAMTCETYAAHASPPDILPEVKKEVTDSHTYKQNIISSTVVQDLNSLSNVSFANSYQKGSLFHPPVLIKEEPVCFEEES